MVDRDSGIPPSPLHTRDSVNLPQVPTMTSANNPKAPGSYKVTLPPFTGIETASLRADHFIYMVEQCGKVHNWSNKAKVNAASLNLRDTAHTWSILYF